MNLRAQLPLNLLLLLVIFNTTTANNFFFEVRGSSGTILSPNYPDNYPKNITVLWTIIASPKYIIEINFVTFDIEKVKDCRYDFVQVMTSRNDSWTTQQKYCNTKVPGLLTALSGWAQIRLVTDNDREFTGFNLTWATHERVPSSTNLVSPSSGIERTPVASSSECTKTLYATPLVQTITISSCPSESRLQSLKCFSEYPKDSSSHSTSCSCGRLSSIFDSTTKQSDGILASHRSNGISQNMSSTARIAINQPSRYYSRVITPALNPSVAESTERINCSLIERILSSSLAGTFVEKRQDSPNSKARVLAIVFFTLTGVFAVISVTLGVLLCSRFRTNRIHANCMAAKNGSRGIENESDFVLECAHTDRSLMTERYTTLDSPVVGIRKIQLTAKESSD